MTDTDPSSGIAKKCGWNNADEMREAIERLSARKTGTPSRKSLYLDYAMEATKLAYISLRGAQNARTGESQSICLQAFKTHSDEAQNHLQNFLFAVSPDSSRHTTDTHGRGTIQP